MQSFPVRSAHLGALLFLGLSALTAPMASAQTADPERKWSSPDNEATIRLDRTYMGGSVSTFDDYIGAQTTTLNGIPGSPYVFDSYCIDSFAPIIHAPTSVTLKPINQFPIGPTITPSSLTHGEAAAWLYNNFAAAAFSDNRTSGALQLAIWEVIEDWDGTPGSIDLTAGNLQYLGNPSSSAVTADILGRANTMLAAWDGQQDANALWISNPTSQDLIAPTLAPEPGSISLLALPLVGAMIIRRRSSSK